MPINAVISPVREPGLESGGLAPEGLDLWREPPRRSPLNSLDLRSGLRFLRRNWVRIVATALVIALVGLLAAFLLFNKYVATALILVDPRDAKVTQAPEVLSNIGPDSIAIESLVQVANSDGFMSKVVDALNLMNDDEFAGSGATEADRHARTLEKLKAAVRVDRRGMTYVIEVDASTRQRAQSAMIANKVAQMIVEDQSRIRFGSNERAAGWIAEHIDEMRDRLHTAEEAAAALKAKLKVTDAGQGFTLQERRVSELNAQLVLASARTAETRARYDQLRAAGSAAPESLPGTIESPVLSSLRQDYAKLTRQVADQATVFGDRYPEVQSLKAQLADNKRQIAAEVGRMIGSARSDFMQAQGREASLAQQVRDAQSESGELGRQIVQLGEIDREAKAQRSVYEQLLTRQKELTELQNLQPSEFRIVSPAVPPIRTNVPKLPLLAAACGILGLLGGLGSAAFAENMRRTIVTQAQAERLSGVPVVGIVPKVKTLPRQQAGAQLSSEIAAWVGDLGPMVVPEREGESRVILVTSAKAGEGKSVIASHLAACLAGMVENVLLIEAQAPVKARELQRPGLLDVLRQKSKLDRALVDHPSEQFSLLPFGRSAGLDPDLVGSLLGGPKMIEAIRSCRDLYQAIIIDGPAVSEANHAAGLAAAADLTLLVVEWDATDQSFVPYALDRLHPKSAAIVFNKVDLGRYALFEPLLPGLATKRMEAPLQAA